MKAEDLLVDKITCLEVERVEQEKDLNKFKNSSVDTIFPWRRIPKSTDKGVRYPDRDIRNILP